MKTAYRETYGPPSSLRIEEVPTPTPKADDVLIRVHATTVNRTDCAVLTGSPWAMRLFTGLRKPKSPIPGTDFAGEVVEVGESVTDFQVGDRVFGFHDEGLNSQAEFMIYPSTGKIAHIPEGISFEQAAASLEGMHYAINFLNKVEIQPGQSVMLNGATGAIGSAALQLLRQHKVSITATCRGEHFELIRSLGADKVIDYQKEDFTQDDGQYDFVFDSVGKSTFGKCKRIYKA